MEALVTAEAAQSTLHLGKPEVSMCMAGTYEACTQTYEHRSQTRLQRSCLSQGTAMHGVKPRGLWDPWESYHAASLLRCEQLCDLGVLHDLASTRGKHVLTSPYTSLSLLPQARHLSFVQQAPLQRVRALRE